MSNQTSKFVKNFSGLTSLEQVTSQLDLLFGRLGDILDSKSQTISLLNGREAVPSTKAGDFVLDYRGGKVVPGMSDGKSIQPFMLDTLTGEITTSQHGLLDSVLLDEDGNFVGNLHVVATATEAGFMSATDKDKLDGINPSDVTPTIADAGAGTPGVGTNYSRRDHTHQVMTGTPVTIGTANSAGSSANLARANHVHAHGDQVGGSLHDLATASVAGFMSPSDKAEVIKLKGYDLTVRFTGGNYFLDVTTGGGVKSIAL